MNSNRIFPAEPVLTFPILIFTLFYLMCFVWLAPFLFSIGGVVLLVSFGIVCEAMELAFIRKIRKRKMMKEEDGVK
jgi:hypothetical protein